MKLFVLSLAVSLALIGCTDKKSKTVVSEKKQAEVTIFEGEKHFKNIKQLTFGGENAEAYSPTMQTNSYSSQNGE